MNLCGITAGARRDAAAAGDGDEQQHGLIPNPTVTYTTAERDRLAAYTPVANAFGTAVVTVTVTDGGADDNLATAGDNGIFDADIHGDGHPVNDAPSFAASNPPTVLEDAGPQTVPSWATSSPGRANEEADRAELHRKQRL